MEVGEVNVALLLYTEDLEARLTDALQALTECAITLRAINRSQGQDFTSLDKAVKLLKTEYDKAQK
jgi:hypothetical protein